MNDVYVAAATVSYVEKAFVAAHQFRMINFGALFAFLPAWELSRLPSSRFPVESCYGLIKTLQRRPCNSSFRAPLKVLNSIDKCVSNVRVLPVLRARYFPTFVPLQRFSRSVEIARKNPFFVHSFFVHSLNTKRIHTFRPRKSGIHRRRKWKKARERERI